MIRNEYKRCSGRKLSKLKFETTEGIVVELEAEPISVCDNNECKSMIKFKDGMVFEESSPELWNYIRGFI